MLLKRFIDKVKLITRTVVFKNFSALLFLQIGNNLLALLIMPYLINVLGVENFGLYSFVFAISMYLVIVTDYGFGFTGVKLISINRANQQKVSSIYHSIQLIKLSLLIIVLIIYTLLIFFLDELNQNNALFLWSFGILIGQTIVPVWFFQGMEKMKFITIINLMIRIVAIVLILIFVKKPEDIGFAIISQSVSFLIAGIISIYIVYSKFNLRFVVPSASRVYKLFLQNRHMFFSTLSLSVYKNFNVVLLGFLSTNIEVGIYAAAEKIVKAVQSFIAPLSQAIYPNMSVKFSKLSPSESVRKLFKTSTYYLMPLLLILFFLIIFKNLLVDFLDVDNNSFSNVFFTLLPVIVFGSLNYLFGIVGLINLNEEKKFNKSTIIGGMLNLVLCFLLSKNYGAIGSATALLTAEIIVFLIIVKFLITIKNNNSNTI